MRWIGATDAFLAIICPQSESHFDLLIKFTVPLPKIALSFLSQRHHLCLSRNSSLISLAFFQSLFFGKIVLNQEIQRNLNGMPRDSLPRKGHENKSFFRARNSIFRIVGRTFCFIASFWFGEGLPIKGEPHESLFIFPNPLPPGHHSTGRVSSGVLPIES